MMQTLRDIGQPIVGLEFHEDFPHEELNPNGYWDLPLAETRDGLKTYYKGKAVKLAGAALYLTDTAFIRAVIRCERNKKDAIESVLKNLQIDGRRMGLSSTIGNAELCYEGNYHFTNLAIEKHKKPVLEIWFEDMLKNKNIEIEKIRSFLCQHGQQSE